MEPLIAWRDHFSDHVQISLSGHFRAVNWSPRVEVSDMNNRPLLWIVMACVAALAVISTIARYHINDTPQPSIARDEPTPLALPPQSPADRYFPSLPAPRLGIDPQSQIKDPAPPETQPTSRPVPGRPVRAAKFKDAVGDEQLTPHKVARIALSYVGADPAADLVWETAINNLNFTPDQRKDMIEDLNEEGFDDPKNITPADLPMIVSRIQLIENLAPQAADEVNAAAFAEAYKDLLNMYAKLTK
jgi:hypothetical protein